MSEKVLTGRTVFIITASAFAVIIGVNLFMAYMAVGTFPGLETKNTYVASQKFDAERAAQVALGWDVSAEIANGRLRLVITGPDGQPVNPASLAATLGRAINTREDMTPEFTFDGRAHVAAADVAPGYWNLRLLATTADGTSFRQRIEIRVKDPA